MGNVTGGFPSSPVRTMGASESKDFRRAEKRLRNGKRAASVVEYWSMAPVLASDMGVATTTKFTESDLDTAARAINWAVEAIPAAVGSELLADDCARLFGSARFCDVLECNGEERWLELRSRLVEQLGQVGITLLAKINQERELAELAGSQMAQAQRVIQEVDLSFSQPAAGRRSGKVAASRELLLARALAPVVSLEAQRILWFVNHGEIAVGQTSTIGSVRIKGNALIQIGVASFSAVHSRRLVRCNGTRGHFNPSKHHHPTPSSAHNHAHAILTVSLCSLRRTTFDVPLYVASCDRSMGWRPASGSSMR